MVNVLLFTDNHFGDFFIRGAGTYRIATEIRKAGYTCQVVDFFGFMTHDDIQKIIDKYVGKETLVVGFGSTFITASIDKIFYSNKDDNCLYDRNKKLSTLNYNELYAVKYPYSQTIILEIMNKIRVKNSNIKFIYGGIEAKYKHSIGIDCFFTNINNDSDILDYLNKIIKNEQLSNEYNIFNSTKFDFTESKILWDESDFIFKNEVLPIEISRGCIFDCTYCNLPIRGKKKLENIKTNNTLKEELIRNYELFNVNSYFFCDSTLNDSTQKLINLHSVILDLPFKIQFSSYLRLDLINAHQEQIDILKEMGLKFAVFGIGSLNEKSLKLIRKTFSRSKMENIMLRLKEKWGNDVLTTGSFIYGLPAETPATLIDLEKWLIENSLNYFDYVDVYPLRLSLNDKVNNNLKSNIAINFQNFGFKKDTTEQLKNYNWISETAGIDYVYANRKSEEIIEILHKDNRCKYANINAIGSYNSGLTFDDLKNNTYLTIKQKLLENNIYFSKIKEYKNKLYG